MGRERVVDGKIKFVFQALLVMYVCEFEQTSVNVMVIINVEIHNKMMILQEDKKLKFQLVKIPWHRVNLYSNVSEKAMQCPPVKYKEKLCLRFWDGMLKFKKYSGVHASNKRQFMLYPGLGFDGFDGPCQYQLSAETLLMI